MQLVHCLSSYFVLSACGILIFLGVEQCTAMQSVFATVASAALAGVVSMLCKNALRWVRAGWERELRFTAAAGPCSAVSSGVGVCCYTVRSSRSRRGEETRERGDGGG